MRYVGVYTFLLYLGTCPFIDLMSSVIVDTTCYPQATLYHERKKKKERAEARQRKIEAVYQVH